MGINLSFKSALMLTVKLQYLLRLIELVELDEQDSYNPGIRIQGNFDVSIVLVFI